MYVLYLDELIILNLVSDFFVLKLTEKICGSRFKKTNMAVSLFFGIVYGILTVFFPKLNNLILKIASGYIFLALAHGNFKVKTKDVMVFFIISSFFAGTISAIYEHINYSLLVFTALFAMFYLLISYLFGSMLKSPDLSSGIEKEAEITLKNGQKISFRVLIDTGNMLKDPLSGDDVMIVDKNMLFPYLNENEKEIVEDSMKNGVLNSLLKAGEEKDIKFRPVFYSTISEKGEMLSFKPECVKIGQEIKENIIVAIAPGEICSSFGCSGIIGVI